MGDPSLSDRFAAWVDFDGSVSLCHALRGTLPLRVNEAGAILRGVEPPPSREAVLSTLLVPRSPPSLYARWHGIFKHRQRTLTSVWGRTLTSSSSSAVSVSSFVYVVSLLLYATIYVVLPLLPTFLDPPWLLLSSHPARFDQPVVLPERTLVELHHLHGRTSAFKNCPFGGSLLSILPSLLPWQSSALYYDCSVPSAPLGLVHLGSVVPAVSSYCWSHGNIMGGSRLWGAYFWGSGLLAEILWGEKVILI